MALSHLLDTTPPRLFTVAACGSLKPAPDGRLRGAYPHLLCSSALPLLVVRSRRTLIQMPFVADAREPATDPVGELLAKFARPLPHRFVADDDAASGQQLLHHTKTEREAKIQPHRMADDLGGEPIPGVAGASACGHPTRL